MRIFWDKTCNKSHRGILHIIAMKIHYNDIAFDAFVYKLQK